MTNGTNHQTGHHAAGEHRGAHGLRDQASHALEVSRDSASSAAQKASDAIETNPLAVLAGGLALGVLVGALLPRSQKESDLLAPLGQRLRDGVTAAFDAARDAGKSEMEEQGLTRDAARDQGKDLLDGLMKVLTAAANAGAKAGKANV